MSQPRKRKRIPYPSPEALAAHDRKLGKEYESAKIQLEELNVVRVKDQAQAPAHAPELVEVEHPLKVAATSENIHKDTCPPTAEAPQSLSKASSIPFDKRAESAPVKHQDFEQNSRQRCVNKSVDTSVPEHSNRLAITHVVIPTWKRSNASTALPGTEKKLMRKIQTPPFIVSKKGVRAGHIYNVKHRFEKGSSVGNAWQQVDKQICFYEEISQYAKIEYAIGDILTITFPNGPGGYAKLIEIRGTCIEDLFIVVQWLYSRTDVAGIGGQLPSLGYWPEDGCVLSDHFQVLGVENIEDNKGPVPLDEVYWQLSGSRLRPLDEVSLRLEKQLA